MADETGSQNDDKGAESAQGSDTANKGSEGVSDAQGANAGAKNDTPEGTVTLAEYESVKARMQAADKAKSDAENKLRELEKKDMSALEKAETEVKERDQKIATLEKQVEGMALQNAFLTDNKYSWHDPSDALALLEKSDIEIDKETGKVKGLRQAIDNLAKKKPHLIVGDKDKGKNGDDSSAASGSATNGRRKGEDDGRDKRDYSKRFPALKR
jgi:hypothetical protein